MPRPYADALQQREGPWRAFADTLQQPIAATPGYEAMRGGQHVRSLGQWGTGIRRYGEQVLGDVLSAATLPGDVWAGRTDPASDEALDRASGLAGMLSLGGAATAPMRGPGVGIFGGRLAKTANLEKLAEAEQMATAGATPHDIWKATGWFQGADQKWRFEIDDSAARVTDYSMPGDEIEAYPLASAISHPEAYAAYPDMQGIRSVMEVGKDDGGAYGRDVLGVESIYASGEIPSDLRSSGLHEMQHAVQAREGFARGGSTSDFVYQNSPLFKERGITESPLDAYRRLAGEVEARTVQDRRDFPQRARELIPPYRQEYPFNRQIVRFQPGEP